MRPSEIQRTIVDAVEWANGVLPGTGENDALRWPAVIAVCEYVETNAEEVWDFIVRWGDHEDDDLRDAIASCGLEHLLEYHFSLIFPRVEELAKSNPLFATTFARCWKFGESETTANAKRFDQLRLELGFNIA